MWNLVRQYRAVLILLIILIQLALAAISSAEVSLASPSFDTINSAVFEVVVSKPTKDSLKYKDPLPFNNLPFAIRNDRYYSIGTAFAIGPNIFVSAAHAMNLGVESQWGETLLRDSTGKVYSIDQIVKYSERRDFIVFTLKNCTVASPFELNVTPKVNQRVFAVGNALGEGVVIRDGQYTSNTPEEEEGAWKWLRFSAAASPGNSGGPLLDSTGKVIGVVLRKSPNENLNIALPIAEVVNAKENMAHIHGNTRYTLPILARIRDSKGETFLALPKSFQELNRTLVEYAYNSIYTTEKLYFAEMQDQMFPNGAGSKALLAYPPSAMFPSLATMKDDGFWETQSVKTTSVDLGENGGIAYGEMGNSLVFSMHKPDNVTLDQLYSDGKLYMDLVLRGLRFSRNVANSPIRITLFGSPLESYKFRDYYGRIWLVKTWRREYDDNKVVTFSLPTPDGLITLMRIGQTGVVDGAYIPMLKVLTNFIFLSYSGTLKEWKEFLEHKDILPDAVSRLAITRNDAGFSFSTNRLAMTISNEVVPVSDNSILALIMGYGPEHGVIVWDISSLLLMEDQSAGSMLAINRHPKPDKDLSEDYHKFWDTVTTGKFPYNSSAYNADGMTRIMTVAEPTRSKESAILHSVYFTSKGTVSQDAMANKLDKVLQGLTIKESGLVTDMSAKNVKKVLLPYAEYSRIMQEDTGSVWRYVFQGQYHQEKGDLDRAMKSFELALSLDSRNSGAYLGRGLVFEKRVELENALIEYRKAVEVDRFSCEAINNGGHILLKLKQLNDAISKFDQAIEICPKLLMAYNNRATSYTEIKRYGDALADRNKVLEINQNYYEGYYNRGSLYRLMGDYENSLSDFDKAVQINDKSALAYFGRGFTYMNKGDFSKAIEDFNKVIEVEPQHFGAYLNRGKCFSSKGDNEKALADYSKALKIDSKDVNVLTLSGFIHASQGDPQMALTALNQAIKLAPDYWYAYFSRGIAYGRKGAMAQSLADFNRAAELEPKNADIYISRGFTFFQQKEFIHALADYNKALEINPKASRAYQNRGNLFAQKKDLSNACADWKRACELGTCVNFEKAKKAGVCQ